MVCRCPRLLSILVAVDTILDYLQESEQTAPRVANILSAVHSITTTTVTSSTTTITSNTSHKNEEKGKIQNRRRLLLPPLPWLIRALQSSV